MVNKRGKPPSRIIQTPAEEQDLWIAFTADVKPLGVRRKGVFCDRHSSNIPGPDLKRRKNIKQRVDLNTKNMPELQQGLAPGLDRRTRARLRRGQVKIEARLDLHGLHKAAAYEVFHRFLERAYAEGKKTVLVITGKGLRQGGEVGVLRQAVPQWLNTERVRHWVHAFDHASPRDGGEGAFYIVMRRPSA